MKLLDLPAQGTRLLCTSRGILSQVVRHDRVRAVGRPPQCGTVSPCALWEAFDFDDLSVRCFAFAPVKRIDMSVRQYGA